MTSTWRSKWRWLLFYACHRPHSVFTGRRAPPDFSWGSLQRGGDLTELNNATLASFDDTRAVRVWNTLRLIRPPQSFFLLAPDRSFSNYRSPLGSTPPRKEILRDMGSHTFREDTFNRVWNLSCNEDGEVDLRTSRYPLQLSSCAVERRTLHPPMGDEKMFSRYRYWGFVRSRVIKRSSYRRNDAFQIIKGFYVPTR